MTRLLTAIASAIIFCSCQSITGSGNIITQARHVNQFGGVKTSSSIDIEVMNDANHLVKVEGDDNVLPYVITTVEDGLLTVGYKSNMSFTDTHVKVYVSAPVLSRLIVSGSGTINSKDTLMDNDHIEFRVSGSGDINALVDAPSIGAEISGSGTIALQGRTKSFTCSIGGSGDINCRKLLSENTTAGITGSGTAHVFASVHLLAKTTGSGDIFYSGSPAVEIQRTGSGSVEAEK
jgi:hypothetical protein